MAYEKELAVAAMVLRGVGSRFFYRQFLPRFATSVAMLALMGVMAGLLLVVVLAATYIALLHYGADQNTAGYVLAGILTGIAATSAGVIAYTFRRLSRPLFTPTIHAPSIDFIGSFWDGLTEGLKR